MIQAESQDDNEERHPRFHNALRILGFSLTPAAIILLFVYSFLFQTYWSIPWKGFNAPDDVEAGRHLLAEQQKKPGYFKIISSGTEIPFPYISKSDAYSQIEQVMADRHLGLDKRKMVEKAIERMAESAPSRVEGANLVNVLRLNIALDQMP